MITGACVCGGVRFELSSPPGPAIYCHCSRCRRMTGSAFATNASVRAREFAIVAGRDLVSEYESSPRTYRAFCSRCGSRLYARVDSVPIIRVHLGTLDSDPGTRSVAHIWVGSKAPWFAITDDLERFDEEPPLSYCAPG